MKLSGKDIAVIGTVCALSAVVYGYTWARERLTDHPPAMPVAAKHQVPVLPPVNDSPATVTLSPMQQERVRFQAARESLKKRRPKDQTEIVSMLGEPSSVMDLDGYSIVQWYYETKEVGRDVISANIEKNGRVSLVGY
jgi:hypothetical protein